MDVLSYLKKLLTSSAQLLGKLSGTKKLDIDQKEIEAPFTRTTAAKFRIEKEEAIKESNPSPKPKAKPRVKRTPKAKTNENQDNNLTETNSDSAAQDSEEKPTPSKPKTRAKGRVVRKNTATKTKGDDKSDK